LSVEIKSWLLVSIFIIFLIPTSYVAKADDDLTSWEEESQISVSIVGNSIINLDSDNRLIRAYVDILNFTPSDGYYYMRIVQTPTDKIIIEKEIIIREKSNGESGTDIAYLIDDDVINTNGTIIQGDYTIEVFSENGNSIAATTFSIIKPSVPQNIQVIENPASEESDTDTTKEIDQTGKTESVEKSIEIESELENVQYIPKWVKNIFILYADDSITENELISALKFLIEQEIIKIN
jgi:hypothetical protein